MFPYSFRSFHFISSWYHFLNHLLCEWMNYYLLSIQPQDTPPCHILPSQTLFNSSLPVSFSASLSFHNCWPPSQVPSLFFSPQVFLEHFLKLWSPMPSGYATQMAGSSANTEEIPIGFNCLLVQKMKIISHRDGKNLTPFTSWSWMSLSPLNLNTWYLFPQKSQARLLGDSSPLRQDGKGQGTAAR